MMQDRVSTARYVNADHTELEFASMLNGLQRISRDNNPHAWAEVHRQAIVLSFEGETGGMASPRPRMIDVTPEPVPTRAAPSVAPALARDALSDAPGQPVPALPAPVDTALKAEVEMLRDFIEMEIAAEYAVLAMLPDGGVDPARKATAVAYLKQEAALRGTDLETLCRSLAKARDMRNRGVMEARLKRLQGAN